MIETTPPKERAILIALILPNQNEDDTREYIDELAFLAETAGIETVKHFFQRLPHADSRTYVGSGKLEELALYVEENEIDNAIFDDELSPSQIRNLSEILKCSILDRTNLILNIFAQRARTSYAVTQVELAQYKYLLPRLTGMWSHLGRQRGGINMRGPGEREIETDRRRIREKISQLKRELQEIDQQMATQRKSRRGIVRVALVGYTNVGKSTLMNRLAKSDIFAENKLFATLDTTVRKVVIETTPFLLSDTVGFIRKLPTTLIESFKSTLDEVRESDLLLHVVDVSHSRFEEHIEVVQKTLSELKASSKPTILIFNKIDAFTYIKKDDDDLTPLTKENLSLDDIKEKWSSNKQNCPSIFISAANNINIDKLREIIVEKVREIGDNF